MYPSAATFRRHCIGNRQNVFQIESPANGEDNPRVDDIYSFIEIKVKEVCRLEIEKLKQEASTSYSNETIASLREENNLTAVTTNTRL